MSIVNLLNRELRMNTPNGEIVFPAYGSFVLMSDLVEDGKHTVDSLEVVDAHYSRPSDFPPEIAGTFYLVNPLVASQIPRPDFLIPDIQNGIIIRLLKIS